MGDFWVFWGNKLGFTKEEIIEIKRNAPSTMNIKEVKKYLKSLK